MRALTVLTTIVLTGLFAAPASAWVLLGADATRDPGQIALLVWGSGSFTAVDVTERVDGADVPVRTVVPPTTTAPDGNAFSGAYYPRSAQWRCDRLNRVFNAAGRRADGSVERATFTLRTPSCRNRLTLTAPRKVRPGSRVVVRVRDRFKLGAIAPRLCVREQRCRTLRIPAGRSLATHSFRPRGKGLHRLTLRTRWQRLSGVVAVGVRPPADTRLPVVLTTGDSLMQSTDAILGDRLTDRARVRTDVFIGSKISRASPVDWAEIPTRQLRLKPRATVIFLGTNEGWPMKTPAGAEVTCCGEPWIAEYERRARAMMRTYLDGGRRALVWLNVPIPRNEERRPIAQAVNVGLARAAKGLGRVAIVDAAEIFTPGGVYRDAMTDRGRTVRVREADGVHLSPDGASIAVRAVIEQLERFGVV